MSEPKTREWHLYIRDMILFSEKVIAYTRDFDQTRFVASGLVYDDPAESGVDRRGGDPRSR